MLKPIILAIAFAVPTAIFLSLANAKSSNGGVARARDSPTTMQARLDHGPFDQDGAYNIRLAAFATLGEKIRPIRGHGRHYVVVGI